MKFKYPLLYSGVKKYRFIVGLYIPIINKLAHYYYTIKKLFIFKPFFFSLDVDIKLKCHECMEMEVDRCIHWLSKLLKKVLTIVKIL